MSEKKILVSHKESDTVAAEAIVNFLLGSLDIPDQGILCTSVAGHQLDFGPTIADQIKSTIAGDMVVVCLLTQDSLKSSFVLFELGAAWGASKTIIIVGGPGITPADLPGPLASYPATFVDKGDFTNRMFDATSFIARHLNLAEKPGGKKLATLEILQDTLRSWKTIGLTTTSPAVPVPADNLIPTPNLNDVDFEILIAGYLNELALASPWEIDLNLRKSDEHISAPPGTSARLIEAVAKSMGFSLEKSGNVIIKLKRPLPKTSPMSGRAPDRRTNKAGY